MINVNAQEVIIWVCVFAFFSTVIITLAALTGKLTLGGGDGSNHNFYLQKLFNILIAEIVIISIGAFAAYIKLQDKITTIEKENMAVKFELSQTLVSPSHQKI